MFLGRVYAKAICFHCPDSTPALSWNAPGPFQSLHLNKYAPALKQGSDQQKLQKLLVLKLKINSQQLRPQRLFSEKTSQVWQRLLTNAPFSDSLGAQKGIRPRLLRKASGQVQLRHAHAYKFYMEPRRDIHLTKIQFLQTLRNMLLFSTPDMVMFLQDILLLRLDLDTT